MCDIKDFFVSDEVYDKIALHKVGYDIETLEIALMDLLDGNSEWYDIYENTGLDEDRCREIANLHKEVIEKYKEGYDG